MNYKELVKKASGPIFDGLTEQQIDEVVDARHALTFHRAEHFGPLLEALEDMTEHYCSLINSGDAGNWNPECEPPVMVSRLTLKQAQEVQG